MGMGRERNCEITKKVGLCTRCHPHHGCNLWNSYRRPRADKYKNHQRKG
jgi:hypothetical protein